MLICESRFDSVLSVDYLPSNSQQYENGALVHQEHGDTLLEWRDSAGLYIQSYSKLQLFHTLMESLVLASTSGVDPLWL